MAHHLGGCYTKKEGEAIEVKCEIQGCRDSPCELACFRRYIARSKLVLVGRCVTHWTDECEECGWDPALPECVNRQCDVQQIPLLIRRVTEPELLMRALLTEVRGMKRRVKPMGDLDDAAPSEAKKQRIV